MGKTWGFSLLELLLGMVVFSIIAVTLMARAPDKTKLSTSYSDVLAQNLRLTKAMSMSLNERYRLVTTASSLQIRDQSNVAIPHPETGSTTYGFPAGVTISPATTIIFDSMGVPYNGSGTALTTTTTFTITSGSNSQTVTLYPQTGLIK